MRAASEALVLAIWIASLWSCDAFQAREPKQREDWTDPPVRYGDTQFEGLHSPGRPRDLDASPSD
jgi:hypothetical protein